uniref:Uncharacterized protein n=1 Tax=Leersia perrieri TaxID=77586 RepID=A0A0D9WD10_9ORYZ
MGEKMIVDRSWRESILRSAATGLVAMKLYCPDIPHEHETQSGYLVYLFMRSWSNGELRLPTYKGCGDLRKQFLTHLLTSPENDSELSTPDGIRDLLNNIVLSLYGV